MSQTKKVPVKVQKRSGFNKSHKVLTTLKCGTITPLMVDELMPNSDANLKIDLAAALPTLASDTYMRASVKVEAFAIPIRLLYGGWEKFFTQSTVPVYNTESETLIDSKVICPRFKFLGETSVGKVGTVTEAMDLTSVKTEGSYINPFPILAYHKVWDDWYRNSLIQKPCFTDMKAYGLGMKRIDTIPFTTFSTADGEGVSDFEVNSYSAFNNGHRLNELHQRNFESDYFTNATPTPQIDSPVKVSVEEGQAGDIGSFTISALRVANSLQKFAERSNLAGTQYVDYLKAHYGANLSSGIAQRSILLGSAKFEIYSNGIYSTATDTQAGDQMNNPFATLTGGKVGNAYAQGSMFIIDHFHTDEPMYILVNATLCPEAPAYSTGIDRVWDRYNTATIGDVMDIPNAMFAGVGNQPIYEYELVKSSVGDKDKIFGYTERYAEWKTKNDKVRGLFRKNAEKSTAEDTLSSWVLQRGFGYGDDPQISSRFLEIPTNFMDDITLVDGDISKYGAFLDSYLDYKVIIPLPEYCQPTLENVDEEHQNTVMVSRNGAKL